MICISNKIPKPPVLAITTNHCTSCGQEHKDLRVTKFVSPPMIGGEEYPFVTQCPETGEPIYIREKK